MGLVAVQQGQQTVRSVITTSGTQFVDGPLVIEPGVTVTLNDSAFPGPGAYVLFDYSAGSFPDPTELLNLTITSNLTRASVLGISNDALNNRVILSLAGNPLNGTQYVEGPFVAENGSEVTLPAATHGGVGTYVLFDVPSGDLGTTVLSGGTPNYLTGLLVRPPTGRIVSGGYAFWDSVNNQVKVTLA